MSYSIYQRLFKEVFSQMALFDAPLHKPGNRMCPNCGNSVWWASVSWWWNGSSTYLCSRCGAELRVAIGRSVLGWALCVGYYALWFWLLDSGMGYAVLPVVYGGILFCVFTLWWFTSVGLSQRVRLERSISLDPPFYKPGNKKCPNCGSPVRRESMAYLWSTRHCTQCGVALRWDVWRAIIGMVLVVALFGAFSAVWIRAVFDDSVLHWFCFLWFPAYFLILAFHQWWFFSIRLREKADLKPLSP